MEGDCEVDEDPTETIDDTDTIFGNEFKQENDTLSPIIREGYDTGNFDMGFEEAI